MIYEWSLFILQGILYVLLTVYEWSLFIWQGILDVLLTVYDGSSAELRALEQDFTADAYFLKVMGIIFYSLFNRHSLWTVAPTNFICLSVCLSVCLSRFYSLYLAYYWSDFDQTWWKLVILVRVIV